MKFNFKKKKIIKAETLGDKLKQARESEKYSLADVAQQTGIKKEYLASIESGKYEDLPGEVYVRNFLKLYTNFLGLNWRRIWSIYQEERKVTIQANIKSAQEVLPLKVIKNTNTLILPKIAKNIAIALLIIACLVYLGFEIKSNYSPPNLEIITPEDNTIISENIIDIKGKVTKESQVTINGQEVFIDPEGVFSEQIVLKQGLNTIEIAARKEHSQERIVLRRVMVESN
jgi:cytoskeletal protein RodZ